MFMLLVTALAAHAALAVNVVSTHSEAMEIVAKKRQWVRENFLRDRPLLGSSLLAERNPQNDNPQELADTFTLTSLRDIERAKLMTAELDESPWSDDYWPLTHGATARRYAEPDFPDSENWKVNYRYFEKNPNASSIDNLSPAEKYDLLVGSAGVMTQSMWNEGRVYYEAHGTVERWMGFCHGWAAASYMLPRPTATVDAMAADGKTLIRFYPTDIKALATQLWAKTPGEVRHAGGRCNEKGPDADENGRVKNQDCFDTNPSTWHLAVVNQLGVNKRSLILDATYDYQVWNQPLYSYRYSYFNPVTGKRAKSLKDAIVKPADYEQDPYRAYRSDKTAYIVGIKMEVVYVIESFPTHFPRDDGTHDSTREAEYVYDLELDEQGNAIGGEWRSQVHPDFIWTPTRDARAMTVGDFYLENGEREADGWGGAEPLPPLWRKIATTLAHRGQPLARVVESLIVLSRVER